MKMEANLKKHIKFLERHLLLLPSEQQAHDINKLAIIFYSIISLSALGVDTRAQYSNQTTWILKHCVDVNIKSNSEVISGFVGTLNINIPEVTTISLASTLFGLLTLLALGDDSLLKDARSKENICKFVSQCQLKTNGGFVSVLDYHTSEPSPVESKDLRYCYIAISILYILGCRTDEDFMKYINVEQVIKYILERQCENGGFGEYGEPHGGYTSCALSALALLNKLDTLEKDFQDNTIEWLVMRQVSNKGCNIYQQDSNEFYDSSDNGGFQGRENKFSDTCYVFWCLNSLQIITKKWKQLVRIDLARQYLLERTQNSMIGGFSKNDEDDPDLYHTCLGIAALQMMNGTFNGALCIPKCISDEYNL